MTSSKIPIDFSIFLAWKLPTGSALRVFHAFTPSIPHDPIFATLPDRQAEVTTCQTHFLVASQNSSGRETFAFAVEVLIFRTESLTTVFVSKADSTGFLVRNEKSKPSSSVLSITISAFLEWLVAQELEESQSSRLARKIVLSLFARSQNQYLFPGSIENATKHVLDDRQLIRWWCKVLDGIVSKRSALIDIPTKHGEIEAACDPSVFSAPQAHLIVPGFEYSDLVRNFYPPSTKLGQPHRWTNTFPVLHDPEAQPKVTITVSVVKNGQHHVETHKSPFTAAVAPRPIQIVSPHSTKAGEGSPQPIPIRCLIPRLPDDPKSRYCTDLDDSGIDETTGHWRSGVKTADQFWEFMSYRQECAAGRCVGFIWLVWEAPISRSLHRNSIGKQTATNGQATPSTGAVSSASTELRPEQYETLSSMLINELDFAGADLAADSTAKWIAKLAEFCGRDDVGTQITGLLVDEPTAAQQRATHPGIPAQQRTINTVVGVRKKRKIDKIAPVEPLTGATEGSDPERRKVAKKL